MNAVVLESVSKRFGGTPAVQNISLQIAEGEFYCLLGPSGCGKTTTLRMIAGLETPNDGRVIVADRVVFDSRDQSYVPPGKRNVGMVFQDYALWPHMTVRSNIEFGMRIRKVPREERESRLAATVGTLKLAGLEGRYPNELSGGQQQRVALARELVTGARVLLMDEPLSNLDAQLRIEMRAELKRIHDETGVTIVYVTHDQLEALTLSSTIAVMKDGRVLQAASPDEIYFMPANLFVASFIGGVRMNTIDAQVHGNRITADGVELPLPAGVSIPDAGTSSGDRGLVLGIRPEGLSVTEAQDDWGVLCSVESVLPMGPTALVRARLLRAREERYLTVQHDRSRSLQRGERIWVRVDERSLHVFDAVGGQRITTARDGVVL